MASSLDPEKVKALRDEYHNQNTAPGGPGLKATNGEYLQGYFIDRANLEAILKNEKVTGISLHHVKHPDHEGSAENVFTLAYSGVEPNAAAAGAVFTTPTCPPVCNG